MQHRCATSSNQAYEHYASAAKSSAYAAFRAGVLALRKAMVRGNRHVNQTVGVWIWDRHCVGQWISLALK